MRQLVIVTLLGDMTPVIDAQCSKEEGWSHLDECAETGRLVKAPKHQGF